jgi:hypothetical protein
MGGAQLPAKEREGRNVHTWAGCWAERVSWAAGCCGSRCAVRSEARRAERGGGQAFGQF